MMNARRNLLLLVALGATLMLSGCGVFKKRKPNLPPAQPPAIEQPKPEPAPAVVEPAPEPKPETETKPATPAPSTTTKKPAPRRKPVHKPAPAVAKPATPPPAPAPEPKPALAAPSSESVQISASVPEGAAENQRRETESLIQKSEQNLQKVTRSLNDNEQAMMRQARNYIAQSRAATRDGDYERAHNLAMKASLLSAELAK